MKSLYRIWKFEFLKIQELKLQAYGSVRFMDLDLTAEI